MTDKEVRQLSRGQLISLLAEVTGENEQLKAEIGRLKEEIEKLTVTDEKLEYLGEMTRQILDRLSLPERNTQENFSPVIPQEEIIPDTEEDIEESEDAVPADDVPSEEQNAGEEQPRTERDRAVPRPPAFTDWTSVPGAM